MRLFQEALKLQAAYRLQVLLKIVQGTQGQVVKCFQAQEVEQIGLHREERLQEVILKFSLMTQAPLGLMLILRGMEPI